MSASLEPIVYVLRAGPEHEGYGDPFAVACTVVRVGDFAYFFGVAAGNLELVRQRRAIVAEMRRIGVRYIVSQRIKDGRQRPLVLRC